MGKYKEFVNVYHFAPLSDKSCERKSALEKNRKKEELYTGKIQVRLKTRTPVFIPDMHAQGKEPGHKELTFFSYDGKTPVIPGSSLRGMLRSVYETITNSCLSVVELDEKPVRRTNDCFEAGLLRKNGDGTFTLVNANKATVFYNRRPDLRQPEKYQEGAEVWVKVGEKGRRQIVTKILLAGSALKGKWHKGYYFKGEPGVRKTGKSENAYVIYRKNLEAEKTEEREIEICKSMKPESAELQELKSVLESYKALSEKKITRRDHKGYKEYSKRLERFLAGESGTEFFPVHYSQIGSGEDAIVYLSPACITKEISYNTILGILEKQGEHHTCSDIKHLCPACRLFGMVEDNQKVDKEDNYPNAWASSVRVQDAVLTKKPEKGLFGQTITLMELSEPKKSSTEFYLKEPEGEKILSWSYDYYLYGELGDEKQVEKEEKRYVKRYTPQISGRKYYWHHKPYRLRRDVKKTQRNCTVTLLNDGAVFKFPIYFEKITKTQMDQLIWICNISKSLGADRKPMYGYKIGKGKPLGLGSIELTVEDVKIRCLEKDGKVNYHFESYKDKFGQNYQKLTYDNVGKDGKKDKFGQDYQELNYNNTGEDNKKDKEWFDQAVKGAFLRLCRFDATSRKWVTYPIAQGQDGKVRWKIYEWFSNNRYNANGGNEGITAREDLVFEQALTPLTAESEIVLCANEVREKGNPNQGRYKGVASNEKTRENPSS